MSVCKYILPVLADIANGVFAVLLTALVYERSIEWWYFVVGIVFAMLPDIDAVPELLRRGKVAASSKHNEDHRTFLHYPVIALSFGLLGWYLFGFWGLMGLTAITLHLINDLYGTGWGLMLFWPFSGVRYKFCMRRVNRLKRQLLETNAWNTLPESERRLRFVVSWKSDEFQEYIKTWGEDEWIDTWYLKFNIVSLLEYCLFVTAVYLAFTTFP